MKKFLLVISFCLIDIMAMAQIPNFGKTAGDKNLYGCAVLKFRANTNIWETYSTLQYGVTDYMIFGADLYTGGDKSYIGYTFRTGIKISPYFSIGAQFIPSFDLGGNHKFAYISEGLFMNGNMTKNGKLFWVTNTWLEQANSKMTSANQRTFLGYTINLGKRANKSIIPMLGFLNDWKFESDVDLSFGAIYTCKNINLYAWTNDVLTDHPRFILAIEFQFDMGSK